MADLKSRKQTIKQASQQVAKGGVWLRPADQGVAATKKEAAAPPPKRPK